MENLIDALTGFLIVSSALLLFRRRGLGTGPVHGGHAEATVVVHAHDPELPEGGLEDGELVAL